jgi:hypothetical protein
MLAKFAWKKRFEQKRWQALDSLSTALNRPATRYDKRVVRLVLCLRKRLRPAEGGLSGARAIRTAVRAPRLIRTVPALSPINRWLKAAGLISGGDPYPTAVNTVG